MPICFISKVTEIPVVQTEDHLYCFAHCSDCTHLVCWLSILSWADGSRTQSFPLNHKAHFNGESPAVILRERFEPAGPLLPKAFLKALLKGSLWVLLGDSQVVGR